MWFVQVIDREGAIRYVPVENASNRGAATEAVRPFLSAGETIGNVAGRHFFEGQGINLPSDDTAITAAPFDPGETGAMTNWQLQQLAKQQVFDDGSGKPPPGVGQMTVAEDTLPFQRSQFLRGLGDRGLGTSGIAGKQRREAFDPTFNRFLFENYFNTPGFDPTNPKAVDQPRFAEFARTSPLFGRGANQQALGQFQQAVNTSRGLNPIGTGFDALTTGQQDILNPQSAGQAGILSSLANQAARARYGVGAEFLGNRDFGSEFFGQGRNTQAQSFADFLNQRIFGG